MVDTGDIQLSFPGETFTEEEEEEEEEEEDKRVVTEVGNETGSREIQNGFRLWSFCQPILIGILMLLFCGVTTALLSQIINQQSLKIQLQHMTEEIFTASNTTKMVQIENNQLKKLLNFTFHNLLDGDHEQMELLIHSALNNFTVLSPENTQLGLLLQNRSQEKTQLSLTLESTLQGNTQLEMENKELSVFLNSTLEKCNLVEEENRKLDMLLNQSLHTIELVSAESERLHLLLQSEQQANMQLKEENKVQRSILFSEKMSFLWKLCNQSTLQCSRCLPGWTEHASRCFFLSQETRKWVDARRGCLDLGADLAVVLNQEDQAFLTNMTIQYVQQHPEDDFHSAWIGLRDMVKEGTYTWVNGDKLKYDVTYWKHMEPNNAMADWDVSEAGQDCVAIVPPLQPGQEDWLNSWDDIVCGGKRHYICETTPLGLS